MTALTQKEKDARNNRALEVRAVMEMPQGRRFVWRLIHEAGVFSRSFTGEELSSAHREGRRDVGLAVMAEVQKAHPAAYMLMLQEETNARLKLEGGAELEEEDEEEEGDDT